MSTFTAGETAYLQSQPLGRMATRAPDGAVQVNPVGFRLDPESGVIDIGGYHLSDTRKYRNIVDNGAVAFVVDDLVSRDPWRVRMIEIRGVAEATTAVESPVPGGDAAVIRIRPRRIISFGIGEPDGAADPAAKRTRSVD